MSGAQALVRADRILFVVVVVKWVAEFSSRAGRMAVWLG